MLVKVIKIAVSLPFIFVIPGFALLKASSYCAVNLDNIDRYGLMVALSAATTSILALILTELGYLQLWILIPLLALASVGFWRFGKRKAQPCEKKKQQWGQLLMIGLLLVLSGILFLQTGEWMTGSDPGLYFNMGNVVGKNGSIIVKDSALAELTPEEHETLVPAKKIFNAWQQIDKSGDVRPIFYRMFPTWIGIFIKLFGTRGAFFVNSVFAMICVVLLYLIGRSLGGTVAGLVASGLLCITSLEIYFARIPVAEILEQFFALAAMLALILYFKHRARAYPLMMFIFLLCLFVCRIEGLLFVVAVVAAFLVRMVTGKFDRLDRWMVNCALAAGFISLVYAQTFIQPYFNSNANSAIYRFSRYINMPTQPAYFGMIVITLAAVVLNIKWFSMGLAKLGRYVAGLFADGPLKRIAKWRAAAAFLCGFLFLFLYLRYEVSPSPYHARPNFVRFTWMMGGAFIFLAVAGLCVLIYMSEPETAAYIFTVTVVSSLLFFGLRLSNDFVPWSLRRHISNVMPLFLLGAGCLAGLFWYMKSQWWKIVSAVVSVVLLVSFIPTTRTILADTAYANVKAEFDYIASVTPDCMVLSPDHETANLFGPVLRYGYGKDCYWIQARSNPRQLRDLVAKRRARGQRVVFMESPASPAAYKYVPWLKLKYTGAGFRFTWKALREFKHRAPSEWVGGVWKPGSIVGVPVAFYDVYPSAPVSEKQAETITLLGSDLKSGYVKNLIDRAWVRGVSEGAGNKSATAIKLPLEKGTKAIRVSINAQLADPEVSEMSIYANGQAVPVTKTVNGQEASYSFVIEAADQQPHSQAFLLRAPPLKIGTASSGIQLLEVQASFI